MSLPDDTPVQFCANPAANAVLVYFAQQAKEQGITYLVKTEIPKKINIPETDISVLLGNLLENAVDACKSEQTPDKKIIVRANTDGGSLCITVDNTFTGTLAHTPDGNLVSTKHKGLGLGTRSVKNIVNQHGGICRFELPLHQIFFHQFFNNLGIQNCQFRFKSKYQTFSQMDSISLI